MKKIALPKQDELARLAAVVLSGHPWERVGLNRRDHAKMAVQIAALLWLRAGECCEEMATALASEKPHKLWNLLGDLHEAAEQFEAYDNDARKTPEEKVFLTLGTCEADSELFRWLTENAVAKKDAFKSFDGMMTAFKKCFFQSFDPQPQRSGPPKITVADARDFLRWRNDKRTKEKQSRRDRKKTRLEKSLADKATGKAEKAAPAKPQRRTSRAPKIAK